MSDGNPTRLFWSAHIGIGGVGLVPGRPKDNWGIGYYYDALSDPFKEVFVGRRTVRDEQGVEAFYNFSVTPWLTVGADLQVTEPALSTETAVFTGLRIVTEF